MARLYRVPTKSFGEVKVAAVVLRSTHGLGPRCECLVGVAVDDVLRHPTVTQPGGETIVGWIQLTDVRAALQVACRVILGAKNNVYIVHGKDDGSVWLCYLLRLVPDIAFRAMPPRAGGFDDDVLRCPAVGPAGDEISAGVVHLQTSGLRCKLFTA